MGVAGERSAEIRVESYILAVFVSARAGRGPARGCETIRLY